MYNYVCGAQLATNDDTVLWPRRSKVVHAGLLQLGLEFKELAASVPTFHSLHVTLTLQTHSGC